MGLTRKNIRGQCVGMEIPRVFSKEGTSPYETLTGSCVPPRSKTSVAGSSSSRPIAKYLGRGVSSRRNVVVSKYFYGDVASGNGSPASGKREYSVRQLIDRVTRTIADWGKDDGYFATTADADRFYDELTALCLHQYGSFNSPVWFNVGLFHRYGISGPANNWRWDEETRTVTKATSAYQYPQASACFIQSVSDDMEGIMRLATSEAMLFKFGSGTGTDLSSLRSSREKLSGWRQAIRSGELHACLRCGRQRRKIRRQDASCCENADAQMLAPGHLGLHRVQDQRGRKGTVADSRRLRGQLQR